MSGGHPDQKVIDLIDRAFDEATEARILSLTKEVERLRAIETAARHVVEMYNGDSTAEWREEAMRDLTIAVAALSHPTDQEGEIL